MNQIDSRKQLQLVEEAQKLLRREGLRYSDQAGSLLSPDGRMPNEIGCSGVIFWAAMCVYPGVNTEDHLGKDAHGMWTKVRDRRTGNPQPGDLGFYKRPERQHIVAVRDPETGEYEKWHVMMVSTRDRNVIGICDKRKVAEGYTYDKYAEETGWEFVAFCRFPLEEFECAGHS